MKTSRRTFVKATGSVLSLALIETPRAAPARSDDLCFASAQELARLIQDRKLSARELMIAHLEQIARVNPKINAIVAKLDDEKCLALAEKADLQLTRGEKLGSLHGLPIAIKDTEPAVGFPFTRGSSVFRNDMPAADSVIVERLRKAGALIIGKTNVPEFAMGSHTYNKVYGATLNPYDPARTAGGSSGGAAAALAAGLIPIANGSDLGGSLRNPGNFNNIVGFRPSVGLVPIAPAAMPFGNLAVKGPLARSVGDVAILLTVIAGPDDRDPACYPSDPTLFAKTLNREFTGVRIAWCPNLGGLPLHPEVQTVLEKQRASFNELGCIVEEVHPDLSGVDDAFLTLRAWRSWSNWGSLLAKHRQEMKPEAVAEIEAGAHLTAADLTRATTVQAQIMDRMRLFQQKYNFVICAVNQVPPFDAKLDWPKEIGGSKMENYVAWMKSAYWISTTACPAISVPAGFTSNNLPVGIQLVGRYRHDFELLQFAHAFEKLTNVARRRPSIAQV